MKNFFLLLAGIFLFTGEIFSQQESAARSQTLDDASIALPVLYKSRLNFAPLIANPIEARIGTMYQFGNKKLRLDIGNSLDLIKIGGNFSVGTDFFTLTRLRSEGNFKFPVETSDYFFGVNFSGAPINFFSREFKNSFRLRLAHISSHVVDGLADTSGLLYKRPFVYSREFADFTAAIDWKKFRAYAGLTYVWATQPRDPNRFIPQFGLEFKTDIWKKIEYFAAYDFKLVGISDICSGVHAAQTGIIFPQDFGTALMFSLYGYQGRSVHGMFYKDHDSYLGVGFQVLY